MPDSRRNVSFQTFDGVTLKGWFFQATIEKGPCIIMTHGVTALKEHFIDKMALDFQKQDLIGGGRYDSDPVKAQDDYNDTFDYVISLTEVDPERIVFWGPSLAGGVAISAAAIDRRIKAVIGLVPYVSGELLLGTSQPLLDMAERDRAIIRKGEEWPLFRVVASTIEEAEAGSAPVFLRDATSFRFFQDASAQGGSWENKITTMSLFRFLLFEPIRYIHRIAPTTLLMVIGEKDENLFTPQLQAFGLVQGPKELHILKGGNHFNHYHGELHEESLAVQIDFLKKYV
ncbi:alpha/beta-hydrolase [Trichoderma compactum]